MIVSLCIRALGKNVPKSNMKLLILTQKIDRDDPVLGFFHQWVKEFAKHWTRITVICLEKGFYDFPKNTEVFSLGKEEKVSRIIYLLRFYKYIIYEHKNYDAVFVHMNQEYVLLGGLIWKFFGKNISMWRNHLKGSFLTNLAVFLSDRVFCTSNQSYTTRFKKTKIMPAGINTDLFKPDASVHKKPKSILFLGRIDPVKNVDVFVEALQKLRNEGIKFFATIAGGSSDKYKAYEKMIHEKIITYDLGDKVTFTGAMSQREALKLYREHEFYVNLTPSGSMDKTIFEALASGLKVLVANTFFRDKLPESSIVANPNDLESLVSKIKNILSDSHGDNSDSQKNNMAFLEWHSLNNLMKELKVAMTNTRKVVSKQTNEINLYNF